MKTKNLMLWVAAFLIVACVVTAAGVLRSRRPSEKSLLFFPGLTEAQCAQIDIREKEKSVRLRRKGDVWVVVALTAESVAAGGLAGAVESGAAAQPATERDYPVDSAMFATVVEKLLTMKKDELTSQNVEKQALFEVDSSNGILVTVRDATDKALAAFRIGKNSPAGWSSHYVRRDGSNDVYAVRGSIKYAFASEVDRWRDKTVIKFPASSVKRISLVKQGGITVAMERSTDSTGAVGWKLISPASEAADPAKVDEVVNALARLTCMSWEENAALSDDSMGLAEPQLVAKVELEGGVERVVQVGKKVGAESKYWVRTPDQPGQTFHVSSYTIEKLDRKAEDFRAPPVAATEAKPAS
jgi:hypothetical protein